MDENTPDNHNTVPTPVPRPRRNNNNNNANSLTKGAYENVSIDLINKKVNINDENLQENANNVKLQADKLFLTPTTITTTNQPELVVAKETVSNKMNDLTSTPQSKLQKTNMSISLNEVNELNALNANDTIIDAVHPVPAPRRPNIAKIQNIDQSMNTSTPVGKVKSTNESKTKKFLDFKPKLKSKRKKNSASYSFGGGGDGGGNDDDECDTSGANEKTSFSMRRASSNSSLSSIDSNHSHTTDSSSISESKRHATASPG